MNFILFKQSKSASWKRSKGQKEYENSEEIWNNFRSNSSMYSIEFDGRHLKYQSKCLLKLTLAAFATQEKLRIPIEDVRGIKVKRLLGVELIQLYTLPEGEVRDGSHPMLVLFSNKGETSRKLQEIVIESIVSNNLND